MAEEPEVQAIEVGELREWIDGHRSIAELRTQYPAFASDDDALAFLDGVRRGLEDVAAGRVMTTEEMMIGLENRRSARRAAA